MLYCTYFLAIRCMLLINNILSLSTCYIVVTNINFAIEQILLISVHLTFDPSRPLPHACIFDLHQFFALKDPNKDSGNSIIGLTASKVKRPGPE